MHVIFILFLSIIIEIDIHFGKNPVKGGNPPKDIKRMIIILSFFIDEINKVFDFSKFDIICRIITV